MLAQEQRRRVYLVRERHINQFYLVFWIQTYVSTTGEKTHCFKEAQLFSTPKEAREFGELKGFEVV